jgi:glycine cleavage system transcriptional repressor
MENILVTTICRSDTNVFNEITKLAAVNECHINYSHLYSLGGDHSMTLQITGNWSGIAKIETALPSIAKRLDVDIVFKRSPQEKIDRFHLPYRIELMALDQPGLVYEVYEFINSLDIHTEQLEISTSKHEQTPVLKLSMLIEIPAESNIADIREQFLIFCDELNLDGTLEPRK